MLIFIRQEIYDAMNIISETGDICDAASIPAYLALDATIGLRQHFYFHGISRCYNIGAIPRRGR